MEINMRFLVGFGLIILGGVTAALFANAVSFIIMFLGVFLFVSFPDEEVFIDYVIANSDKILVRKRYYYRIFLFQIAISALTFGTVDAKPRIMWKEAYYKCSPDQLKENFEQNRISRKEYIVARNEQRRIYSTTELSWEFMNRAYSIETIGFKKKKRCFVIVSVLAVASLMGLTVPADFYAVLCLEAFLIPMIILWYPSYKDAKIIQEAYNRTSKSNTVK